MKSTLFGAGLAALALFVSPAAFAQEQPSVQMAQADQSLPPEVQEYLAAKPSLKDLTPQQLQQRVRAGRTYMNVQGLPKNVRNQVAQQVRQARAELASRKGGAQANKPASNEADQSQTAETAPEAKPADAAAKQQQTAAADNSAASAYVADTTDVKTLSDKDIVRRIREGRTYMTDKSLPPQIRRGAAEKIKALRAEAASRKGQGQQAGNANQQTGNAGQQQTAAKDSGAASAYVADTTDLKTLSDAEIANRIREGRGYFQDRSLPAQVRRGAAEKIKALRAEAIARKSQGKQQQQAGNANQQTGAPAQGNADSAQAERLAKALVSDDRPPHKLDDKELRTRLNAVRTALGGRNLTKPTEQALRQKLAADRNEVRRRVGQGKQADNDKNKPAGGWIEDRRPAAKLNDNQLRARIIDLREAAASNRFTDKQRETFKAMLVADRQELNRRVLIAKREREVVLRDYRDRTNVNVAINIINVPQQERPIGYVPPPVWAAEADEEMIEDQLIAPPVRTPQRRYTIDQIENEPEIRESMPAVELDTINFGFGEAFVREEELEDMDKIGEVLEKILAAHPNEIFLIEGHTDAVGSDQANLELSRQRAQAVKEALGEYYNIAPQNLKTAGYGERYLKIATEDPEAENRRVTVRRVTPLVGELEG